MCVHSDVRLECDETPKRINNKIYQGMDETYCRFKYQLVQGGIVDAITVYKYNMVMRRHVQ